MENSRLRFWVLGSLAGFSAVLAVWVVSDGWRTDLPPGSAGEAEPEPEIAQPILATPDKAIEPAEGSEKDAGLAANSAGKIPYLKIKKEQIRLRHHPDVTANSPEDRIKGLSRLAELGYKPWEAEELRTLWDGEMDKVDRELGRLAAEEPDRSLNMDGRLLLLDAYGNLRENLEPNDYAAVRYAAEKTTRIEIYRVTSGSREEEFGILTGDQLDSYDGERLFDINQFKALTKAESDPNRPVVLGFRRDGREFFVEIPGGIVGVPLLGVVAPP